MFCLDGYVNERVFLGGAVTFENVEWRYIMVEERILMIQKYFTVRR